MPRKHIEYARHGRSIYYIHYLYTIINFIRRDRFSCAARDHRNKNDSFVRRLFSFYVLRFAKTHSCPFVMFHVLLYLNDMRITIVSLANRHMFKLLRWCVLALCKLCIYGIFCSSPVLFCFSFSFVLLSTVCGGVHESGTDSIACP